ncbi:pentapeptide repeat-containing protein, partial [Candidatus Saccharibacteria bacterium]|nr:pentapeptide repeat-containing protein [Candidatus Saccharibacteria bacterium]
NGCCLNGCCLNGCCLSRCCLNGCCLNGCCLSRCCLGRSTILAEVSANVIVAAVNALPDNCSRSYATRRCGYRYVC